MTISVFTLGMPVKMGSGAGTGADADLPSGWWCSA